jgi:hypothetical protein
VKTQLVDLIKDEFAERIVLAELRGAIKNLKRDIKQLSKLKTPELWQKSDLEHNKRILAAMEQVYDYYGGNIK